MCAHACIYSLWCLCWLRLECVTQIISVADPELSWGNGSSILKNWVWSQKMPSLEVPWALQLDFKVILHGQWEMLGSRRKREAGRAEEREIWDRETKRSPETMPWTSFLLRLDELSSHNQASHLLSLNAENIWQNKINLIQESFVREHKEKHHWIETANPEHSDRVIFSPHTRYRVHI